MHRSEEESTFWRKGGKKLIHEKTLVWIANCKVLISRVATDSEDVSSEALCNIDPYHQRYLPISSSEIMLELSSISTNWLYTRVLGNLLSSRLDAKGLMRTLLLGIDWHRLANVLKSLSYLFCLFCLSGFPEPPLFTLPSYTFPVWSLDETRKIPLQGDTAGCYWIGEGNLMASIAQLGITCYLRLRVT